MNNDLVKQFQDLKLKHNELLSEKIKYEAKRDQLSIEIKSIQDKYPEYDLSSIDSVKSIIEKMTDTLTAELNDITNQYNQIKAAQ